MNSINQGAIAAAGRVQGVQGQEQEQGEGVQEGGGQEVLR